MPAHLRRPAVFPARSGRSRPLGKRTLVQIQQRIAVDRRKILAPAGKARREIPARFALRKQVITQRFTVGVGDRARKALFRLRSHMQLCRPVRRIAVMIQPACKAALAHPEAVLSFKRREKPCLFRPRTIRQQIEHNDAKKRRLRAVQHPAHGGVRHKTVLLNEVCHVERIEHRAFHIAVRQEPLIDEAGIPIIKFVEQPLCAGRIVGIGQRNAVLAMPLLAQALLPTAADIFPYVHYILLKIGAD